MSVYCCNCKLASPIEGSRLLTCSARSKNVKPFAATCDMFLPKTVAKKPSHDSHFAGLRVPKINKSTLERLLGESRVSVRQSMLCDSPLTKCAGISCCDTCILKIKNQSAYLDWERNFTFTRQQG